jgi:hypothetical protein
MLSKHETELIMEKFFNDCLSFWKREGHDSRDAFAKALNDVRSLERDPFSPCGDKLDEEAKLNFIRYREMDLGVHNN